MNNNLFSYPKVIPEFLESAMMYRTSPYKTLSFREKNVVNDFEKRLKKYAEMFNTKSKFSDMGDTAVAEDEDYTLEVYKASDSVWWTNDRLAYREEFSGREKLTSEKEALELAKKTIEKFKFKDDFLKFQCIKYTEVSVDDVKTKKTTEFKTEIHIYYNFVLNDIPVMGPGAKLKISFADEKQMSQVLYFWRNPEEEEVMQLLHPVVVLNKFVNDPRFMRLSKDSSSVKIHDMKFAYYAMPPFDFQRFLIPVYVVNGSVHTSELKEYEFTNFIVAVDLPAEKIKNLGIVADPASCTIFE